MHARTHRRTWQRIRLQVLAEEPLCAECHEQKTRAELGYEEREVVDRVCVWIEREIANADHD